jgi:thioesterase domain-containing protein
LIQFTIDLTKTYGDRCLWVYAFRASGYEDGEAFLYSIERIVEEYIFQMRRLQLTGPYQLLGYSFGGLVTFEIAGQLQEKYRDTVRSLILIDPSVPALENVSVPEGIDEHQFSMKNALRT